MEVTFYIQEYLYVKTCFFLNPFYTFVDRFYTCRDVITQVDLQREMCPLFKVMKLRNDLVYTYRHA